MRYKNVNRVYQVLIAETWITVNLSAPLLQQVHGMRGYRALDKSGFVVKQSDIKIQGE